MAEIIGVRFKNVGKVYYFDPIGLSLQHGDRVIVETSRGLECGEVALPNKQVDDSEIVPPLKPIIRVATEEDLESIRQNAEREKEAFSVCAEKIAKHKLDMKLVDVEYTFDGNKILFYFTSDGRVDFRELVKDLAGIFRTRIELRQIGVRDESKMLGGLGICGRPFCCSTFLGEFQPVSIKMAKEQSLSLNPTKISGTCGRLMCCLKYEQDAYEDLLRVTPRTGAYVETPEGRGVVVDVSLLTGALKVRLDDKPDAAPYVCNKREIKVLEAGSGRRSKQPPKNTKSDSPAQEDQTANTSNRTEKESKAPREPKASSSPNSSSDSRPAKENNDQNGTDEQKSKPRNRRPRSRGGRGRRGSQGGANNASNTNRQGGENAQGGARSGADGKPQGDRPASAQE